MAKCEYKRLKIKKLCSADLRHIVTLYLREQQEMTYNNELNSSEIFTAVFKKIPMGIETLIGVKRWGKINIEEKATHLFYMRHTYNPKITGINIDHGNNFLGMGGIYFRILDINNQDEDNQFLIFQTTERGDQDLKAAH